MAKKETIKQEPEVKKKGRKRKNEVQEPIIPVKIPEAVLELSLSDGKSVSFEFTEPNSKWEDLEGFAFVFFLYLFFSSRNRFLYKA